MNRWPIALFALRGSRSVKSAGLRVGLSHAYSRGDIVEGLKQMDGGERARRRDANWVSAMIYQRGKINTTS